jgi:glycosidase
MNEKSNYTRPVIYQMLPRLFGNSETTRKRNGTLEVNGCGKFEDITIAALKSIKELGITHVWYTGIIEHAQLTDYSKHGIAMDFPDVVKGKAGSPYAIKDYFDVDPDLATSVPLRMQEFEALVNRTHQAGLKVIIDLVPNHLARQYISDNKPAGIEDFGTSDDKRKAFSPGNNFYYLPGSEFISPAKTTGGSNWKEEPARVTGNNCFKADPSLNDWYDTVKLNYGEDFSSGHKYFNPAPDTWKKMLDVVLFWSGKKIDAFRVDMAGMVPVEFWQWLFEEVKKKYPSIQFIAEIYEPERYHEFLFKGGFDYLYDKELFYNTIRGVITGTLPASEITAVWQKVEGFHHHLLYFLENHDEQRIASRFFVGDAFKALPGLVVMATMLHNPLLIYFGQELGEEGMDEEGFSEKDGRTSIYDYWSLPLIQKWAGPEKNFTGDGLPDEAKTLRAFYRKILRMANDEPALARGRFYDLIWSNLHNNAFDSDCLYACFRYCGEQILLVMANFSDEDKDFRLRVPRHFFDQAALNERLYFRGHDKLKMNKMLQFPAEIALNAGLGGRLKKHSASVFELEYYSMERGITGV